MSTTEKSKKTTPSKTEASAEKAPEATPKKKTKLKKMAVSTGRAYINATYNNTIITLTDSKGDVLTWSSAGSSGFKGTRKSTPFAAQTAAENAVQKAKVFGLEKVAVYVKGVGSGREQAIRGLQNAGLFLLTITDVTPIPHNGCRPRKARRV